MTTNQEILARREQKALIAAIKEEISLLAEKTGTTFTQTRLGVQEEWADIGYPTDTEKMSLFQLRMAFTKLQEERLEA
ncbi:MAG TPA: hypothetical protein V6D27_01000 [Vampirovibrionales bacterium]